MLDRRHFLGASVCGLMVAQTQRADAMKPLSFDAVVDKDAGKEQGRFACLADALAAAPADAGKPYRIMIGAGDWRERVTIDKPNVHLVGKGRDTTRIVFNHSAGTLGEDGKPVGTFGSATVKVTAPGFSAHDLTIANDYDYVGGLPKPGTEGTPGGRGAQAVALAIQDAADGAVLTNVHLFGHQDTLYVDAGRALFEQCRIEGGVDFIFGGAFAVFDSCTIVSRLRPGQDFNGFVAAPSTNIKQEYGLVFLHCRLEKEAGVAPHSAALGRPWRRTKTYADGRYGDPEAVGACTYIACWMDDHIIPDGWMPMGYNVKGGGRAMLQPEEVRFREYGSTGPGAGAASPKRRMLSADEAGVVLAAVGQLRKSLTE